MAIVGSIPTSSKELLLLFYFCNKTKCGVELRHSNRNIFKGKNGEFKHFVPSIYLTLRMGYKA